MVTRCGCPGSSADVSENEIIVRSGRASGRRRASRTDLLLPPHAASTHRARSDEERPSSQSGGHRANLSSAHGRWTVSLTLDRRRSPVTVADDGASLLEVLRDRLGIASAKDGCSPQGQCGCCTVLVDGEPRVACVTPARRVAGPLDHDRSTASANGRSGGRDAFCATGASQCGFCTPGIIVRLDASARSVASSATTSTTSSGRCSRTCAGAPAGARSSTRGAPTTTRRTRPRSRPRARHRRAPRSRAARRSASAPTSRSAAAASPTTPRPPTRSSPCPTGAAAGPWPRRSSRRGAPRPRCRDGARPSTCGHPIAVPDGDWARDAAHAVGRAGVPRDRRVVVPARRRAGVAARQRRRVRRQGRRRVVMAAARELADQHGRAGPRARCRARTPCGSGAKRPPIAAGVRADGTGVVRVARTPGIAEAIASYAPSLRVEEVDVPDRRRRQPPRGGLGRGGGAARGRAASTRATTVVAPNGARATRSDRRATACTSASTAGDPLDEVVLRSYCIGAAHMALGWVTSEGIAVDDAGEPHDLTIRSFGVLRAVDTPPITVEIERRPRARATAATPCSPRWPPPRGSRKAARRLARPDKLAAQVTSTRRHAEQERSAGAASGPYTPVVRAGDWLVVSGQVGIADGKLVPGGLDGELRQAIANLRAQLEANGASLDGRREDDRVPAPHERLRADERGVHRRVRRSPTRALRHRRRRAPARRARRGGGVGLAGARHLPWLGVVIIVLSCS